MKKILFLLAIVIPMLATAQADQKLINKAKAGDTKSMLILAECYENGAGVPIDSAQAFQWFQKAADLGNGDAAVAMSRYYLQGIVVPKDTARYLAIRQEWANKKHPNGLAALGTAFLYGFGVNADTSRAIDLYNQSIKVGSSWGYDALARMYETGDFGFSKDIKTAEKYYLKALKLGDLSVNEDLAFFYIRHSDIKNSWKYLNEALKWKYSYARVLQAQLYANGTGVDKDLAKAQQLVEQVVADHPSFEFGLSKAGLIFMPSDSMKAISYWRRGAALHANECRYYLSTAFVSNEQYDSALVLLDDIIAETGDDSYQGDACFVKGNIWHFGSQVDISRAEEAYLQGVNRFKSADCAKALAGLYSEQEEEDEFGEDNKVMSWYMRAVELGDTTALVDYGKYCAYNGDLEHAEEAFSKLVRYNNTDGYYWLAVLYAQQDQKKAMDQLLLGDKHGNAFCRETLGEIYEEGAFGETDLKKAEKYYLSAATASSYNKLAMMYLNDEDDKNDKKAVEYTQKAADMGYIDAIYRMGYLYETGRIVDSVDHVKALEYYRILADNNVPVGLFKMGLYYELGDGGVEADSVKAIGYYCRAADLGNTSAMCYLGDFHRIGQYLPLDKKEAFRLYSMADSLEDVEGTYYVGRSYLEGCGVDIDTARAMPYLYTAAHNGIGNAAFLIAEFYNYGKASVTQNADSALRYYIQAYQGGNVNAAYILGVKLYNEDDYGRSFALIREAAVGGNGDAVYRLAAYLQDGIGCEKDPEQAYQLFEYAAQRYNSSPAYTQMGLARLQGNGCRQDETLGKQYLDTAATMGNPLGMFYLSLCYFNGYGCEPDSLAGNEWLVKAADNGNVRAMNLLGDNYEEQEDFDNAVKYFQMAADRGSWDGICNLGYCYETGHGVLLSFRRAVELYRQAADEGSTRAMKMLANCYLEGNGVDKDNSQALALLEKAAGIGDLQAMYYIGQLYESGDYDFTKDLKKAKEWYKKAAAAGFQPAQTALSRL